jgi:hypothetical protein
MPEVWGSLAGAIERYNVSCAYAEFRFGFRFLDRVRLQLSCVVYSPILA